MVMMVILLVFGVSVKNLIDGMLVVVKNLFSVEGLYWFLFNVIKNFSGFVLFGVILVLVLGVGLVECVGLLLVLMVKMVLYVNVCYVSYMVLFIVFFSYIFLMWC